MWDAAESSFRDLDGRSVAAWAGVEWALTGGDEGDPPVFEHPDVPFRQLWALDLALADGGRRSIVTYQDGTAWGLHVRPPVTAPPPGGAVRWCTPDLPRGRLEIVGITEDDGVLAEVLIAVGGHRVLLMAGEVESTWGGGLEFVRCDESVLVFTDPAAADRVSWRRPRPPRSPVG